jgi:hypothetical protein
VWNSQCHLEPSQKNGLGLMRTTDPLACTTFPRGHKGAVHAMDNLAPNYKEGEKGSKWYLGLGFVL